MKTTFRISPKGSDTAPSGPWATLTGARDALRKLRAGGELAGHAMPAWPVGFPLEN